MSEVKRYHLWASLECQHFSKAEAVLKFSEEEDGMWVQYQDYARLKAEVERLTERNTFLEQIDSFLQGANENAYEKRCDELEAEVERLRASSFVTAVPVEEYEKLKNEVERSTAQYNGIIDTQLKAIDDLKIKAEHIELFKSVVEKFFNSADLKNQPDAQSCYALAEKLKQLPDCILDFTEEQVRDNPAWALAVFRHKVKEMQYKRIHDLNAIGGEQEEVARLKAEVERLTEDNRQLKKAFEIAEGIIKRMGKAAENAAKEGKPSV